MSVVGVVQSCSPFPAGSDGDGGLTLDATACGDLGQACCPGSRCLTGLTCAGVCSAVSDDANANGDDAGDGAVECGYGTCTFGEDGATDGATDDAMDGATDDATDGATATDGAPDDATDGATNGDVITSDAADSGVADAPPWDSGAVSNVTCTYVRTQNLSISGCSFCAVPPNETLTENNVPLFIWTDAYNTSRSVEVRSTVFSQSMQALFPDTYPLLGTPPNETFYTTAPIIRGGFTAAGAVTGGDSVSITTLQGSHGGAILGCPTTNCYMESVSCTGGGTARTAVQATGGSCTVPGIDTCTTNADCGPGRHCHSGFCYDDVNGAACSVDADCGSASSFCDSGCCEPKLGPVGSCYCQTGTCGGTECASGNHCILTSCAAGAPQPCTMQYGSCYPNYAGNPCSTTGVTWQCGGGTCSGGICN